MSWTEEKKSISELENGKKDYSLLIDDIFTSVVEVGLGEMLWKVLG